VTVSPASPGASAHKFTRLNDFSGLSAHFRNFFLPAIANPAGGISKSVLSDFNGLRRHFRVISFLLPAELPSLDSGPT
jgi:hypothetical protein